MLIRKKQRVVVSLHVKTLIDTFIEY